MPRLSLLSCWIACLLGPLAISARPSNAQAPASSAVASDSELVADRHRWSMLPTAPDSVQRSTSDPYPALFTQRRMAAAEACGFQGYLWRMPDMLRVSFVENASMDAKARAVQLRSVPVVALVSTLDLAAMKE